MKSSTHSLLTAALFALGLISCQKAPPPDEATIFGVVQENLRAMEQENVEAMMATIDPRAAAYKSTRELTQAMFQEVDLKYELSDLKLISATPEEARVSFVQRMEKTGGPGEFRNNIVHGVHLLRPDRGKWKIHGTMQLKVTDLDGQPLTAPDNAIPTPPDATETAVPVPPTTPPVPAPPLPGSAPSTPPAGS